MHPSRVKKKRLRLLMNSKAALIHKGSAALIHKRGASSHVSGWEPNAPRSGVLIIQEGLSLRAVLSGGSI